MRARARQLTFHIVWCSSSIKSELTHASPFHRFLWGFVCSKSKLRWRHVSNRKSGESDMATCSATPRHSASVSSSCLTNPPRESRQWHRVKLVLSLTRPATSRRRHRNSISFPMPSRRSVCLPSSLPPSLPSLLPRTLFALPSLSYRTAVAPLGAQLCGGNGHRSHGESSRKVSRVSGRGR